MELRILRGAGFDAQRRGWLFDLVPEKRLAVICALRCLKPAINDLLNTDWFCPLNTLNVAEVVYEQTQ